MAVNKSQFALHLKDSTGAPVIVLPGEKIPAWAADQVTNPYVLGEETDGAPAVVEVDDADDSGADADSGQDDDVDPEDIPPPPMIGKGSGVKDWAAYAAKQGFEVEGLKRNEIVEALKAEGIRVE
ncbi:hypothetical protein EV580_1320 [Mycobacterium sp. BK086]|uniref:hypothetical protein n=1 Tax=Mycobacterium sp. BK086 TaxID=2512165 RepID=UPI001061A99C|nr:hypothetical protein [Mycobacterium sp. BK086]TDO18138.1 hypothetical protein EV580_1320 [Mycobacterium sp. BK086]